MFIKHR